MSSIIEGYSYDIFISYRQNDNKYDGWVTEFVDNLNKELEANIKDKISVYFDINPTDGLLETDSVDKSLENKLKCLIFIPIISRTYCDSKSFAWQHEFCTFNKLAKEDKFGRDIRLSSGNVASRILPVKIYDLDTEDKELLENELGGVLRSVDFIYKSAGVNRPLRANEDHPQDNFNKTYYRDQINKVANAVKEIITALKKQSQHPEEVLKQDLEVKPSRNKNLRTKIIAGSITVLALIILGISFFPKLIKPTGQLEKSIAVLPFRNDSPSDSNAYFINGLMEEILNKLEKIEAFSKVISRTSTEQYRGVAKLSMPKIAKDLDVNYIVEGSGQKYGDTYKLRVQLIEGKSDKHLWSETYEKEIQGTKDIFNVQTQIAQAIAGELKAVITFQEKDLIQQLPTDNTLAYDYYLKGNQYFSDLRYDLAINMYGKAIELDPNFVKALLARAYIYLRIYFTKGNEYNYYGSWLGFDILAKADIETALNISPDLPDLKLIKAYQFYAIERNNDQAMKLLNEIKVQMHNNPSYHQLRAAILRRMGKFEESLKDWKSLTLLDPLNASGYIELGHTYRIMRKYPESLEFYNKSLQFDQNPENKVGKFFAILLWKGNIIDALKSSGLNDEDMKLSGLNLYYYYKQYDKLLNTVGKSEDQFGFRTKTLNIAQAYFLMGNQSMSEKYADSAVAEINLKIKESPKDNRYYAALGYAYAYKGDKKSAIENAQKAVKLMPIKIDEWQGFHKELDLAIIYAITGEYNLAMDKIEFLLTIPGELSVPILRIDPVYDKLRRLPRFQKILETEYITKYQ